jgi:hypothetical protein
MLATSTWGPVLFGTLVPLAALILGGLVHVVFRLGKLTQKVESMQDSVDHLETRSQMQSRTSGERSFRPNERRNR